MGRTRLLDFEDYGNELHVILADAVVVVLTPHLARLLVKHLTQWLEKHG